MKTIPLTQGKVTFVDDGDFKQLNIYKWYAIRKGRVFYAARDVYVFGSKDIHIYMHREILGAQPGQEIDHINGDGLDNTRTNLRFCTRAENIRNTRGHLDNASGYKGVSLDKRRGKLVAQIWANGKHVFLGRFDSAIEAAHVYDVAARKYFGEFAKTNFMD